MAERIKLLLDEHLAPRLARELSDLFPGTEHVEVRCGLGAADILIWDFAGANGFVIFSKDSDFMSLSLTKGAPPKVIWLRIGNASTDEIRNAIRSKFQEISNFAVEPKAALFVLG